MIDVHTHIFNEQIYRGYQQQARKRVTKALVLQHFEFDIKPLLDLSSKHLDLAIVATVNMELNIPRQLRALEKLFRAKKIVGIKLYPGYQHFFPSDKRVYPVAQLCQKYNKPLIFHTGDVWDRRGPGKALLKYPDPMHVDELAVRFPDLKLVIAHFGFPHHMETAQIVNKNKNVYTEISGTIDEVGDDAAIKRLRDQYARDLGRVFAYFPSVKRKVMFGTDYVGEHPPLNQFDPYVNVAEKLFSLRERTQIFTKTAERLFFS